MIIFPAKFIPTILIFQSSNSPGLSTGSFAATIIGEDTVSMFSQKKQIDLISVDCFFLFKVSQQALIPLIVENYRFDETKEQNNETKGSKSSLKNSTSWFLLHGFKSAAEIQEEEFDSLAETNQTPSKAELDDLFSPMYEEYFEKRPQEVSTNYVAPSTLNNEGTPSSSSTISIIVDDNEVLPLYPLLKNKPLISRMMLLMNPFKNTLQTLTKTH
ncbi:hypothetical protein Tco_0072519 [Tanacetum coccineum]